ncbi:MAG: TolC family protein, partial [Tepidisphaeraceae bacterium]
MIEASIRHLMYLVAATLVGCAPMPRVAPEESAAVATGVGEPFVFRFDPEPLDAPGLPPDALTLSDVVRLALGHDPRIQASLARARAAQADAKQARLLPNPVISVAVRFPEAGGKPIIDADIAAELLAVLKQPRRISAADSRLRAACADTLIIVLDVVKEVQSRYVSAQTFEAQLLVLEARGTLLDDVLKVSAARVEAGEASRLDLLTIQSQRIELDQEIRETRLEARRARVALARLIGQPSGAIDWKLAIYEVPSSETIDEAAWIRAALAHRPEVQAATWELSALGDEEALSG